MDIFEKASKLKLRFVTAMGSVTIEDLWDMKLTSRKVGASLDDLAKALSKSVKESGEESFVVKKSTTNTALELKFDIVKHIITVKMAEAEAKSQAVEKKAKKDRILELIATKEDESLADQSLDELREMAASL